MVKRHSLKLRLFIGFYCIVTQFAIGQNVDSLLKQSKLVGEEEKIEVLHQLIVKLWLNYPDKAMVHAHDALNISKRFRDKSQISKSLRLLAGVHYYKGDFNTSLQYNTEALNLALETQDSTLINNCYNNIGLINFELGSYQNSLENLLRSKSIKEKIGENYGMPITLNNIGLVYNNIKDYNRAREYFFDALDLAKQYDEDQIIYSLNNIGFTYLEENELVLAKDYFDQSLEVAKKHDNKNRESAAWRGQGEIAFIKNDLESARRSYKIALNMREEIGDQKGIAEMYYLMAQIEHELDDPIEALRFIDESHKVAQKIGARDQLLDNYKLSIEIYTVTNNVTALVTTQAQYINLRDSLYHDGINRNLSLIPLKIKEEGDRITLLEQQKQIEKDAFRTNLYLFVIGVGSLMLFLLLFYYRKNRLAQVQLEDSNLEIGAKNEEITAQKEILVSHNSALELANNLIDNQKHKLEELNQELEKKFNQRTVELNAVNKELKTTSLELDNLIYKSSHDIRGPLVRLMGVCNLALMEISDPQSVTYFRMIDKASKRLNMMVDKLKVVSELNMKDLIKEEIDFEKLIQDNLNQNKYIEGLEDVKVETDLTNDLSFYSDPTVLDLIIFNMLQNAVQLLKGSKAPSGKIKISITKNDLFLNMMFDVENIDLIINKQGDFYNILAKDDDQQNLGIGLYTVKQCVSKLGGDLLLIGDARQATRFTVNLPLNIVI